MGAPSKAVAFIELEDYLALGGGPAVALGRGLRRRGAVTAARPVKPV